jgi:glycosyltransferase involved in cell wall biosynthesis
VRAVGSNRTLDRAKEVRSAANSVMPTLSVIVPVYNQAQSIAENIKIIRQRIASGLDAPPELIVVSDGSIDLTAERALESVDEGVRVIHYDRNLGKGYAIKAGALEARGRWIAYVDADLDLDPASLAAFVEAAESESLDFVIGSKRHPDSNVQYPRARRVSSWLYQHLVRLLFHLDVRDTQVGLKLFRREVAEQVLPLLLVKRFAFDLELLAIARHLGFRRIKEMPVTLHYRFTGSGVGSVAVMRALVDTAAIFYRLRILNYYRRRQLLVGTYGWTRPRDYQPLVSVLSDNPAVLAAVDYPNVEFVLVNHRSSTYAAAAERASGDVLAFVDGEARPAGNWLSATTAFLGRQEIAAVVTSKVAPHAGSVRALAAAAVMESRVGCGSLYFRFTPGSLRFVNEFPGTDIVIRRETYLAVGAPQPDQLCDRLISAGSLVLYTPETVVVSAPPPLFRPHLDATAGYARARAKSIRRRGFRALRPSTPFPIAMVAFAALGWPLLILGGAWGTVWLVLWAAYALTLVTTATVAALRFRSFRVAALALAGLVLTHLVYAIGLLAALIEPGRRRNASQRAV